MAGLDWSWPWEDPSFFAHLASPEYCPQWAVAVAFWLLAQVILSVLPDGNPQGILVLLSDCCCPSKCDPTASAAADGAPLEHKRSRCAMVCAAVRDKFFVMYIAFCMLAFYSVKWAYGWSMDELRSSHWVLPQTKSLQFYSIWDYTYDYSSVDWGMVASQTPMMLVIVLFNIFTNVIDVISLAANDNAVSIPTPDPPKPNPKPKTYVKSDPKPNLRCPRGTPTAWTRSSASLACAIFCALRWGRSLRIRHAASPLSSTRRLKVRMPLSCPR